MTFRESDLSVWSFCREGQLDVAEDSKSPLLFRTFAISDKVLEGAAQSLHLFSHLNAAICGVFGQKFSNLKKNNSCII